MMNLVEAVTKALTSRPLVLQFKEDNQAMIQIMKSGRNPTLRHLHRTHKISMCWLMERFADPSIALAYIQSEKQCADIFTKPFADALKWQANLLLIHHVEPRDFWDELPLPDGGGTF